jgi:hypothetical protein
VTVINVTDGGTEILALEETLDGLGRIVSTIDLTTAATLVVDPASIYWIRWHAGGALLSARRADAPVEGAGEVLEYMIQRSTVAVDLGASLAAFELLNECPIDGYLDDTITPWDWIADNLLPLLPVSLRAGPGGLYPVIWRFDATALDAVTDLDATPGRGLVRTSGLEEDGDPVGEFRLRYALAGHKGEHRRTSTLTGNPDDLGLAASYSSLIVRSAVLRWPLSWGADTLDSDLIYKEAAANYVLAWISQAHALPSRRISYGASWRFGWIPPGSVVTLTDPAFGIVRSVALVEELAFLGSSEHDLEITLRLIEDPARDSRSVG